MSEPTHQPVTEQPKKHQTNRIPQPDTRTFGDILRDNLLTYFNLLNLALFFLILATGSYRNTMFMGVVISNAVIGIFQELYLKRKLSKLKTVRQKSYMEFRDGRQLPVLCEDICIGAILRLQAGDEIPCDMQVLSTDYLEVSEALMTGEGEPIIKAPGDTLLSGSFLVAGECVAKAIRVGEDTEYAKMLSHAGKYEKQSSEILKGIEKIIQMMTFVILPLGIVLFFSSFYREDISWQEAVITTTAGIVGMIPSGLYLITTVTAGSSVLKLARKKAVVNSFTAVEALSRVSTLCLDKTGTLTTGDIRVKQLISYSDESIEILKLFAKVFPVRNPTMEGIYQEYGDDTSLNWDKAIPFSSVRKYSEVQIGETYYRLGTPDHLVSSEELLRVVSERVSEGDRVLALTKEGDCLALVVMSDVLKKDAREVLDYLFTQQFDLKIISGDRPETVSAIAKQLGFRECNRYLNLHGQPRTIEHYQTLVKNYSIFGGVTPEEKRLLVQALKKNGETVAMVGDGVNDVLALKEADLSIAMAQGDQASKAVSQVVLSDSDFTPVPHILREGRRIVNNIERVASLYLLKTVYSVLLTICYSLLGISYPFAPVHMTVIGVFTVGIPSFFLAMEPNDKPVSRDFLTTVIHTALPNAVLISLFVTFFGILEKVGFLPQKETLSFYLTAYFCFFQLIRCSLPFSPWKAGVVLLGITGFFICLFVPGLLLLTPLSFSELILLGACLVVGSVLLAWRHKGETAETNL
ncbi:MAG: HAD-IC family P-type ATPase [Clostridia bacterium]|nr:HAD-IC family P-type ATPase [Clostridia bacterium]